MGVSYEQREDKQKRKIKKLTYWIKLLRQKRSNYNRKARRNIRVEAVLTYAISRAEQTLRIKQMSRMREWQKFQQKMVQRQKSNDENESSIGNISYSKSNPENIWTDASFPELTTLDNFMTQLNQKTLYWLSRYRECLQVTEGRVDGEGQGSMHLGMRAT